jgi:hypothetical protein
MNAPDLTLGVNMIAGVAIFTMLNLLSPAVRLWDATKAA